MQPVGDLGLLDVHQGQIAEIGLGLVPQVGMEDLLVRGPLLAGRQQRVEGTMIEEPVFGPP